MNKPEGHDLHWRDMPLYHCLFIGFRYCTRLRNALILRSRNNQKKHTVMTQAEATPIDMKVLMNHIYEYKKGVRRMVLFTFNKKYEDAATRRLESQNISYIIQPIGNDRLNLFFGRKECLDAIRLIVTRPLNELTPEEDFILGAMLGYDICMQCERYCERRNHCRQCREA